jgi:prepilin-type N-terminal cleavage/methylation domain-containing protein
MRNTKGFTLIELLIVVVIIGILAAIAIPKFASTKEKAYVAAMKSDLKNFVTAEEAYFADNNTYGTYANVNGANLFTSTTSVTVATASADAQGFGATATHASSNQTCGVFVGDPATYSPNAAVNNEGEVACW